MILVGGCFTFFKFGLLLTLGAHVQRGGTVLGSCVSVLNLVLLLTLGVHVQRGGTVLGSCVSVLNLANFVKVYTGTALRP